MPKATQSQAGRIVSYFRTTALEQAQTVFDICKDVMRERAGKSSAARARTAQGSTPGGPAQATAAEKAPKVKAKAVKRKKAKGPKPVPAPTPVQPSLPDPASEAGEAGDLQP